MSTRASCRGGEGREAEKTQTGNIGDDATVHAQYVLRAARVYLHANGCFGPGMHRIARGVDGSHATRYVVDMRSASHCAFSNPNNVHKAAVEVARAALHAAVPVGSQNYVVHSLCLLYSPALSARQQGSHIDFTRSQMGNCYTFIVTLDRKGVLYVVDDAKQEMRVELDRIGDFVCFHKWRRHAGSGYEEAHWRLCFYAAPNGVRLDAYKAIIRVVRE
jgi:hypothetical protein